MPRQVLAAAVLAASMAALPGRAAVDPTLSTDRAAALEPGDAGTLALSRVLADYYARGDGEGGFSFWLRLPLAVRARNVDLRDVRHWRNLLEFLRDSGRRDAASCAVSGRGVLADPLLACDYGAQLTRYRTCISPLGDARSRQLLADVGADQHARGLAPAGDCLRPATDRPPAPAAPHP